MGSVRRVVQSVSRVFSWLSGFLVLVLMLLVVAEVVLRQGFTTTLGGTLEISEVLLAFLVFLGVPYAQQTNAHVNTNLVTSRIPPRAAAVVRLVGLVVAAVVLLWASWATLGRGLESLQTGEARFGLRSVPVWPARLVIPIGLALLALECIFSGLDAWHQHRASSTADVAERAGGAV